MSPRILLLTIGATALAFAVVLAGILAGTSGAFAQTSTPAGETAEVADERAQAYDGFVATLASALGVGDAAEVDAAIRTALKQQIDELEAAGELTVEATAARKAVIDVAEAPLSLGFGMNGRFAGGHGPMRGDDRGPRGGFGGFDGQPARPDREDPVGGELPADADPADEAPVEGTPTA